MLGGPIKAVTPPTCSAFTLGCVRRFWLENALHLGRSAAHLSGDLANREAGAAVRQRLFGEHVLGNKRQGRANRVFAGLFASLFVVRANAFFCGVFKGFAVRFWRVLLFAGNSVDHLAPNSGANSENAKGLFAANGRSRRAMEPADRHLPGHLGQQPEREG